MKDSKDDALPKWVVPALAFLAVAAFTLFALIARGRQTHSPVTRFDPIHDMDAQLKYRAQARNPAFADGRAMRLPPAGTVARGRGMQDDMYYRGLDGATWTVKFPIPVDAQLLRRGQDRFNIYCAPCHGLAGYGDGIVAKRADALQEGTWTPPASYHNDRMRQMPVGQIFNTMTYGIRNMPGYGPLIVEGDRWAIIAYIRALQKSQHAGVDDVPEDVRPALK